MDSDSALATVRLEVRSGLGRATTYEVGDGGFLIGSVPGCDLRLPGSNLPPIICVIGRSAVTASLRRLAPVLPILVNGKAVAAAYLHDGDSLSIGPIEIVLNVQAAKGAATAGTGASALGEREQKLKEQQEQLETDRVLWHRRRDEIETECRQRAEGLQQVVQRLQRQEQELTTARAALEERERAWKAEHEELGRRQHEIAALDEETRKHSEEGASVRRELGEIRQQLYQRYHERRERLIKQQQAIHKAARRLQQRKQRLEAAEADLEARRQEWQQKQIET
ncbi:MAG: hypothetical protein ACRD3Y_09420, partial [Bryobacteraceae bacterium]